MNTARWNMSYCQRTAVKCWRSRRACGLISARLRCWALPGRTGSSDVIRNRDEPMGVVPGACTAGMLFARSGCGRSPLRPAAGLGLSVGGLMAVCKCILALWAWLPTVGELRDYATATGSVSAVGRSAQSFVRGARAGYLRLCTPRMFARSVSESPPQTREGSRVLRAHDAHWLITGQRWQIRLAWVIRSFFWPQRARAGW